MLLMRILWFLSLSVASSLAQQCVNGPCAVGCCNENGWCGFGPDFCGKTCKQDCDRKAECNPGFGLEWAQRDKCPLNVCCSKHGFCGTTEEFCGDKKISHKTCSKTNGNARVVGYYEGWATKRPCNVFYPEQIPIGLYTHINFAFAIIDPETFKIGPAAPQDINIYKRLMLLKQLDPALKVYIAVGGWSFNDPGPTATTFSDLAASLPRQKVFMESLLSFMSTYGFDGLDLDWEYPVSSERSGRDVDYANFPAFMTRLKKTLSASSKGLTVTLPASYWYLQHFDLENLGRSVDWFNIMSYDLHGTWDQGNKWTGANLNAHTNLTEIDAALDLLWRNDVDPNKVVLGLGFYGRTFSMTNPACNTPGCTYESGGQAGRCSKEVGILMNSEIDEKIKENSLTPVLYKKEGVKVASWGNQWVSYDDEETLQIKSEYAQTLCLGGLMVWAISHDTKDAKYHTALAKAANRKILSMGATDGSAFTSEDVAQGQCMWTNCGEPCYDKYVPVRRTDKGSRKNELMIDETGCGKAGQRTFCCPATATLPSCGWYTHNNGNCNSECPTGKIEIGSNNMYCKKVLTYQAACCDAKHDSMKLYAKGEWGPQPNCDDAKSCPVSDSKKKTLLGKASSGTGAAVCNAYYFGQITAGAPEERKYCYDDSNTKERFSNCQWYSGMGKFITGAPKNWCISGCPTGKIRIGMGHHEKDDCAMGSVKAFCCEPNAYTTVKTENSKLTAYRDGMGEFMKNPRCILPVPFDEPTSAAKVKRDLKYPLDVAYTLLLALLTARSRDSEIYKAEETIWNEAMGTQFENLHFPAAFDYIKGLNSWLTQGPHELTYRILCSMWSWNARAAKEQGGNTLVCYDPCTGDSCGDEDPDDDTDFPEKRRALDVPTTLRLSHSHDLSHRHHIHHRQEPGANIEETHQLEKRRAPYQYTVTGADGRQRSFFVTLGDHDPIRRMLQLDPNAAIGNELIGYNQVDDCGNPSVQQLTYPQGLRRFQLEHVLDGQLIAQFLEDASNGRLRSGATASTPRVTISYFVDAQTAPIIQGVNAPPLPGVADPNLDLGLHRIFPRVMECLGARTNTGTFVGLETPIHQAKTLMMQGHDIMGEEALDNAVYWATAADCKKVIGKIRAAIAARRYMAFQGAPNVNDRLVTVINNVAAQFRHSQQIYNANYPNDQTAIADFWSEWVRDMIPYLLGETKTWTENAIKFARQHWGPRTDAHIQQALDDLASLEAELAVAVNVDLSSVV